MPVHFWLPAAMVAPTPVSALLHAVAVVKAGVFTIMKVMVYVFGIDLLQQTAMSDVLLYVAAFTVVAASLVAMAQDNLKRRLAYSTVSQLSYIVAGALLASQLGIVGGSLQIAMHAVGKITLFFCAGAIYIAAHKTEVSELSGPRADDAGHLRRLSGRRAFDHRAPAFRRHVEQMVPGARRASGASDRHRRGADALLAPQHRLSPADPASGLLRQAARPAADATKAASTKRRSPA